MQKGRTISGYKMPTAWHRSSQECWFIALFVILSVYRPFQDMLPPPTEKFGPVTQMLSLLFAKPPLLRNENNNTMNTAKVFRDLRTSVEAHVEDPKFQDTEAAEALLNMLKDSTVHQDPQEAWGHLYAVIRQELGINSDNSFIGLHLNEALHCTKCNETRINNDQATKYLFQALQLNSLTTDPNPSVQDAIKHFFAPEESVQVRCCAGKRNTDHDKYFECLKGDAGMVFYGPFDQNILHRYRGKNFNVDPEIRLPFKGSSSGLQSSYQITGFTAREINSAHHVAVIYDVKGIPYTYDGAKITKGLPDKPYVPSLFFYELLEQETPTTVQFFRPQSHDSSSEYEPETDSSASSSPLVSRPGNLRPRRNCMQTDFYRPGQTYTESKKKQPRDVNKKPQLSTHGKAEQRTTILPRTNSDASTSSLTANDKMPKDANSTPERQTHGSNQPNHRTGAPSPSTATQAESATPQHRKQSDRSINQLASKYPANTWVWAKHDKCGSFSGSQGAFLAARIIGPATPQFMNIQWCSDSEIVRIKNKKIHRKLRLEEERLLFSMPQDGGRELTLAKVTALLDSQGTSRHLSRLPHSQQDCEPGEGYSGVIETSATTNWKSLALPWLLDANNDFSPKALAGLPFKLPTKVPADCFHANNEFKSHPSFGNCVREVLLLLQQLKKEDILYQQLFAWAHLLPILLLRAPNSCGRKGLTDLITKRCTMLLEGQWEHLYKLTVKDARKWLEWAARRLARPIPQLQCRKLQQATQCIRAGNLSKGARILTGNGISMDPDAHKELEAKHPQNVPTTVFSPDWAPLPLSSQQELELEHLLSTRNLARVAGAFAAESHPDQWGWRAREYIAPLLQTPELGDLIVEVLIMPRHTESLPHLYGECYRGGKLLALSKAPKPGLRPIAIGDTFRRILDKALQPFSKKDLARTFENTYVNAKQFASGSKDGAEKFLVSAVLALQEHPAPEISSNPSLEDDPKVMLNIDLSNAFNTQHRQAIAHMLEGNFTESYAKGRLTKDNVAKIPQSFNVHMPSARAHYEGDGRLTFVDAKGQVHEITSRTGVHQGCVLGGKLFNIGTFSVVGVTMADHPEVFCSMFSDNITLVGRLSKAFSAADDLRGSLAELGLLLQPAESSLYIPSYIHQDNPPALLDTLREQYPELQHVPWQKEGITLLGCPVGTDSFVQASLARVCEGISQRISEYAQVDDGLIHLQLLKFSVNNMLPYFLRTTSPAISRPYAQQVDALTWNALLDFSEVPTQDREDQALRPAFEDARCQASLPISEGGLGIMPNECVCTPAYYSAVSRALSFAAGTGFKPIREYLDSPAFLDHPLCMAYVSARQDLITWGAQEPPSGDALLSQQSSQPTNDAAAKSKKARKPPVLPTLQDVISQERPPHLVFPDQRVLTKLAQKAHPSWSAAGLTDEGKKRTAHLSKQTISAHCDSTTDETGAYLQGIGNFSKEQQLRHSPLAFITHTGSLSERFPRDVFAVLLSYLLGLPAPRCLQNRETTVCEGCSEMLDQYGHHRMTCAKTSSYHAAHTQLAGAFAEIARKSGVPYTDKGVPSHLTTKKVGDGLLNLSSDSRKLVVDFTICHPHRGTTNGAGAWNDNALAGAVRNKWNRHGRQYAVIGYAFAPCAMTTYGRMDAHLLRLLYIFAQKRAEMVHVNYKPLTSVEHLFGLFFAQGRARIGAAVARGMALRALGCSLFGVSKVFLRHIAPARYRDQTLSSGQHLTAGLSQWRLALAA